MTQLTDSGDVIPVALLDNITSVQQYSRFYNCCSVVLKCWIGCCLFVGREWVSFSRKAPPVIGTNDVSSEYL